MRIPCKFSNQEHHHARLNLQFIPDVFSSAVIIFACATATAQQPKLEMHRVGVSADDGTGWHPAVDYRTHDARAGEVSHVRGIKFMAVEIPVTATTLADLGAIPKSFPSTPQQSV
jgi:hypothetical protein